MGNYAVVRLDNLSGQDVHADMRSVRVYDKTGSGAKTIDIENGTFVLLNGLEDGQREIFYATPAAATSAITDVVLVATPEITYNPLERALDDFTNKAGNAARAYVLRRGAIFSVTKEGFVGGTVPTKGSTVGLGANGKIAASGSNLGKCVDINVVGRYTYYAIQFGPTEAASA